MNAKEPKIVLTFKSTTDALETEAFLTGKSISGRIIPVPRSISASCGLAWCSPEDQEESIRKAVAEGGLKLEHIFFLVL